MLFVCDSLLIKVRAQGFEDSRVQVKKQQKNPCISACPVGKNDPSGCESVANYGLGGGFSGKRITSVIFVAQFIGFLEIRS